MAERRPFRLYQLFTSHMVLQREKTIVISGKGEPGVGVRLCFADAVSEGVVDADGEWSVAFPPMEAGGPYALCAGYADSEPTVVLDDILVGEVWICSGQSNMEMPVYTDDPHWRTLNAAEEVAAADYPNVRFYNMVPYRRLSPDAVLDDAMNLDGWRACTPETVREFSACGYFFGRKLNQDLDIPIGLISNAWGGTVIQAWMSEETLLSNGFDFRPKDTGADLLASYAKYAETSALTKWMKDFEKAVPVNPAWIEADFDASDWTECVNGIALQERRGRMVFRLTCTLTPEQCAAAETLDLGYINDVDFTYLNGEYLNCTDFHTPSYWSVHRVYPVEKGRLVPGRNVIVVYADNHYGGGSVNFSSAAFVDAAGKPIDAIMKVVGKQAAVLPQDFSTRPDVPACGFEDEGSPNYPSTLYNAMMAPCFRYPVRGVIWYQGCSNSGQLFYYTLHKLFIEELRERWNDPEMPFLLVQLQAFDSHRVGSEFIDPAEIDAQMPVEAPAYALTREIQAELPKILPHVGMITAIDCGDANDIHPRDKQTLGWRLACKAEDMLGWKKQTSDGPEFCGMKMEINGIRLYFKHAEGLHTTDGEPPRGFVAWDKAGTPSKAITVTIEGETILVQYPDALIPMNRVRYAFTGFCFVNLVNKDGWPMLPFRTDKPDYSFIL